MTRNFKHISTTMIHFVVILVLSGCANKVSPTGGEKDLIAPQLSRLVPENYSTNLSSRRIQLSFDEFISLKDLNKQLIISPIMDPDPEINLKRKTITIDLPDNLDENTTYTMNFGSAIVDITEGNAVENFQYVFSTGDHVDSLTTGGKAMRASDRKTEKGVLVMLYNNLDDSVPAKQKPDYFGKTNEAGIFVINNLKAGKYRMVALKDNNNNMLYDLPGEYIAFEEDFTVLPDSMPKRFFLSKPKPSKLRLKQVQSSGFNKARVVFNKSAKGIVLQNFSGNRPDNIFQEFNATHDTMFVYLTDTVSDSLALTIRLNDQLIDTVNLVLKRDSKKTGGRGAVLREFTLVNNLKASKLGYNQAITFKTAYPITTVDKSKFQLFKDSVAQTQFEVLVDSASRRLIKVKAAFKEGAKYELNMLPHALSNIVFQSNDTVYTSFTVRKLRTYGSVNLKFNPKGRTGPYVLTLVNDKDKAIKTLRFDKAGDYTFNYINPGTYRLKLFIDKNGNERLDPGNYWRNLQPEKVFYCPESIKVRSNWDISIRWDLQAN